MQLHIIVHGRVQGVNFRNMTKRKADDLDITGWVRNDPEGTVTIAAKGEAQALKQLQNWMKESPGLSGVKQLSVQEMNEQRFSGFAVKRQSFVHDYAQSFKNLGRSL